MAETETDLLVRRDRIPSDRKGAIVTIITPEGFECRGRVIRTDGDNALVRAFERLSFPAESHLDIALIQALPKKEKMSFIIQKATELGVDSIQPCTSARSVLPGGMDDSQDKSHRWSHVARSAVEQCRRRTVPIVSPATRFERAIDETPDTDALKPILHEKERGVRLRDVVARGERPAKVVIVCGPEGALPRTRCALRVTGISCP